MSEESAVADEEIVETRRGRGHLESDVKTICDKFVTGEIMLAPGESLTPYRIAKKIVELLEPGSKPPSTGAVSAVLQRFAKVGFIEVSEKPFAFLDYTEEGRSVGLRALREEFKQSGSGD